MIPIPSLVVDLLYLIYFVVQLSTCVFLSIRMYKTKQMSLLPLIIYFLFKPMEIIFILIFGTSLIIGAIGNISLVFFTKYTFYKEKRSPFLVLLALLILLTISFNLLIFFIPFSLPLSFIVSESEIVYFYIYLLMNSLFALLTYPWLGLSSLRYYNSIKNQNIEPWIKKRYQIIGFSSLIITLNSIVYLFFPIDGISLEHLELFVVVVILLINTVIFSFGNLIAWIMPQKLKDHFNRNYQIIIEEDISEKELLETIKTQLSKSDKHRNH